MTFGCLFHYDSAEFSFTDVEFCSWHVFEFSLKWLTHMLIKTWQKRKKTTTKNQHPSDLKRYNKSPVLCLGAVWLFSSSSDDVPFRVQSVTLHWTTTHQMEISVDGNSRSCDILLKIVRTLPHTCPKILVQKRVNIAFLPKQLLMLFPAWPWFVGFGWFCWPLLLILAAKGSLLIGKNPW